MMGVNFGKWLGSQASLVATQYQNRAIIQQARIVDKVTDVALTRSGVKLAPQTVRVELDNTASPVESAAGTGSARKVTIFGIRGHPELDDTDIEAGDAFVMDDVQFTVISVNRQIIGQVQATCEAVG